MINLNKKVFKAVSNSDTGEVDESTRFNYMQDNEVIFADYSGGQVLKGHLLGKQLANGDFDFYYHHVNLNGELKIGKCLSRGIVQENGKIKLQETWEWLCDDMSKGKSELIEV